MERTGMENEKNEERNENWLDREQDELRMGKWKNGRREKKVGQGMEWTEKWKEDGEDIELIEYGMVMTWDKYDMEWIGYGTKKDVQGVRMVGKGKNRIIAKDMESKQRKRNIMNREGKGWEDEERGSNNSNTSLFKYRQAG